MIITLLWPRVVYIAKIIETILALGFAIFLFVVAMAQLDMASPMHWVVQDKHVTTDDNGRSFIVHRHTCLDRAVSGDILPRLVSVEKNYTMLIPLPAKPMSAELGCNDYAILVLIPDEVPPGDYYYLITYRLRLNMFKTITEEAPPVIVTVTK